MNLLKDGFLFLHLSRSTILEQQIILHYLHSGLRQRYPGRQFLANESVRIMRLLKDPLQRGQLLRREGRPASPGSSVPSNRGGLAAICEIQ